MSKGQTLRTLVTERLAAAAEEIFVLFERTIAEYEEELCRCKEENQRKQQLLDQVLYPRIELVRGNIQKWSTSPGPGLNQEISETPHIKEEPEEQSIKQEEQQLPVSFQESSGVYVKTEESSLLQQTRTEPREDTPGEDISSEIEGLTELSAYTDNGDDREAPFCFSATVMDIEADRDQYNQDQIRDRNIKLFHQNKPETVHSGHVSGAERKKHQFQYWKKRFGSKKSQHIRDHTREKPYRCSSCEKTFTRKGHLIVHARRHNGLKPYSCSDCEEHFEDHANFERHKRIHTGEKPYSCPTCEKTFNQKRYLQQHKKNHKREKPFSCLICEKTFKKKAHLEQHKRTHTGEKPYSCSSCDKTFSQKVHLSQHERTHTGEKPYSCSICKKTFVQKRSLDTHTRKHTGERPFSCTVCERTFTSKAYRKKHMITHSVDGCSPVNHT